MVYYNTEKIGKKLKSLLNLELEHKLEAMHKNSLIE
jgi:hypothetical protein